MHKTLQSSRAASLYFPPTWNRSASFSTLSPLFSKAISIAHRLLARVRTTKSIEGGLSFFPSRTGYSRNSAQLVEGNVAVALHMGLVHQRNWLAGRNTAVQ